MARRAPTAIDARIASRVRAIRVARGVSQTRAGAAIGVSYQQFAKYEDGVNRISAGALQEVAEVLDVPVWQFFDAALVPREGPTLTCEFRDAHGKVHLREQHRGATGEDVLDELIFWPGGMTLLRVLALDLQHLGPSQDVTIDVLHALAAHCETEREEVARGLLDAFQAYDVPLPREPGEFEDEDDEHRLSAAQLGVGRSAA
ncbi:helix-turn-helix domain-containing protein [Methylobacterium sp. A54F]